VGHLEDRESPLVFDRVMNAETSADVAAGLLLIRLCLQPTSER
jgi:hypothetical protein